MKDGIWNHAMARHAAAFLLTAAGVSAGTAAGALRFEAFNVEPADWEGVNHRNAHFEPREIVQDFGYSSESRRAGGEPGEIGGQIQPAAEPAFFGCRLPASKTLDTPMSASGRLFVAAGSGHCLLGFFQKESLAGWRTPNTMVIRINGRGETFHCHLEYCTRRWRANAGVVGEIVPGEKVTPIELPSGRAYEWRLDYDPAGADGKGLLRLVLEGVKDGTALCEVFPEHRGDGITVDHFGMLPVLKSWDSPGEIWVDDLRVEGLTFDFGEDPRWEELGNRRKYVTTGIRPKFDFGWSPTGYAGGAKAGELGGVVYRGDCREPQRMACYGGRIEELTLDHALEARGKAAMLSGVSDSTASIGFYHSEFSMVSNPSQKHAIPMDYLGINIEGPSSEGFFFYPVYRDHGDGAKAAGRGEGELPRIYPDGQAHDWALRYDPDAGDGAGRITLRLDDQECSLQLEAAHRRTGARFNRFGICTPWVDGNAVRVYFDDLWYTDGPE